MDEASKKVLDSVVKEDDVLNLNITSVFGHMNGDAMTEHRQISNELWIEGQ